MKLKKDSILQRVFDLDIRIRHNHIEIKHKNKRPVASKHGLAILEVFATPKTLEQGVNELQRCIKSIPEWVEYNSEIRLFYDLGILQSPGKDDAILRSDPDHFDAADVHIRMLNDTMRTTAFQAAIHDTVTSNDIVLDIGTGTGVLAATAALAGAKHVYAIEMAGDMPKLARRFFEANGLGERITIIEGDSTHIDLPEKADVMVSEIIGNDPLDERIISTTADAVKRHLKPEARLIPNRLKIFTLPVTVPENLRNKHVFTRQLVREWQEFYGLDFSIYADAGSKQTYSTLVNTCDAGKWPFLSKPVLIADIRLNKQLSDMIQTRGMFEISQSGILGGMLVYFELELSKNRTFSIHPEKTDHNNSWASKLWIPGKPIKVESGWQVKYTYRYDEINKSQFEVITPGDKNQKKT